MAKFGKVPVRSLFLIAAVGLLIGIGFLAFSDSIPGEIARRQNAAEAPRAILPAPAPVTPPVGEFVPQIAEAKPEPVDRQSASVGVDVSMGDETSLFVEPSPLTKMKNRGSASGLAAAETYLWLARSGDGLTLQDSFFFDKRGLLGMRASADTSFLAALSADAVNEIASAQTAQVLDHQVLGPNDELVKIRFVRVDKTTVEESFLLRRTAEGWKRDMSVKAHMNAKSGGAP